jgi:hypothetical protein
MENGGGSRMALPAKLELEKEEEIIEKGMRSFVEVGNALMRIRDNDLYTVNYNTFESYCKDRWGFTKSRANQLIGAANIVDALATIVVKPATESVARELTGIRNEEGELDLIKINEVWQEAVETSPEGKVTAAHVKQVIHDFDVREEEEEEPEPEQEPEQEQEEEVPGAFTDHYVTVAISHLKRISKDDPTKKSAGIKVINWCIKNLCGGYYYEFRPKKDK